MFIDKFNPSALSVTINFPFKRIDDFYSESLTDFLYVNFFHLHIGKLKAIYVGDEYSKYIEIADVIRCEMRLEAFSEEAVEAIHSDLSKITQDWLLSVGGYQAIQP